MHAEYAAGSPEREAPGEADPDVAPVSEEPARAASCAPEPPQAAATQLSPITPANASVSRPARAGRDRPPVTSFALFAIVAISSPSQIDELRRMSRLYEKGGCTPVTPRREPSRS